MVASNPSSIIIFSALQTLKVGKEEKLKATKPTSDFLLFEESFHILLAP